MFENVINILKNSGKEIYIIYAPPDMIIDPPLLLARRTLIGYGLNKLDIFLDEEKYKSQTLISNQILTSLVKKYNLDKIYISNHFWDYKQKKYSAIINCQILYRDNMHLSQLGVRKVQRFIANKVFNHDRKKFEKLHTILKKSTL